MQKAQVNINLGQYISKYIEEIEKVVPKFLAVLPRFLAMNPARFKTTSFNVFITNDEVENSLIKTTNDSVSPFVVDTQIAETCLIRFKREPDSLDTEIELINESSEMPGRDIIRKALGALLARVFTILPDEKYFPFDQANNDFFASLFPPPFIITCERTGASLFRTELVISKELSLESDVDFSARKKLGNKYEFLGYQLPVNQDLNFVIRLREVENQQSFIAQQHPEIITFFNEIIGGAYTLKDNQVKFSPSDGKESLGLAESSSTVRSLMAFNYYLKHKAKRGQILMFDEPELNLHPDNQRKLACLLVMLVNAGVKVLINTHSDYIIREINILIMLNSAKEKMAELIAEYGYNEQQLLAAKQIKCYVAANGEVKQMDVNDEYGIEVTSFDDSIQAINLLHNKILFGK